ncbi:glycerophosphodiester phosphodiesterase [Parafrankia colletiae]|uniref:glycerophosphodiester phosphodiesterase n=1 Tax=Parafrankia colletiae TaxID=573497 RepID=A0A1S1QER8_9ACTN|nr:glycerophosphodiester phosphodiesterase [Parafrankia colletiae]MCK9901998.1 glycerophosphodiester phosphodiesterase [Frankia sp. Cpl3]OHV33293.1 glycerophosphodiester phosphodiesterase [Parafrankia colletiae]
MGRRGLIAGLAAAPLVVATASAASAAPAGSGAAGGRPGGPGRGNRTLVIGHRGASGYRPEHTLASYELAARMGADFVEPDLVVTKDGHLVCRHEPEIGGTTDVADRAEFATRRVTKQLDGVAVTGWFTEDFTLAELKKLRAKERLPAVRQENTLYDGRYEIPTLIEVLELRRRLSAELGREIGVYPETKHPTYFQQAGLALEQRLLDVLNRNGLNTRTAPVFVQSFETKNLGDLRRRGLRTNAVQLLSSAGAPYDLTAAGDPRTYADLITPAGLKGIAAYANGVGPEKVQVIPVGADGKLAAPTALVRDAHAAGLLVHPYTFRAENQFLPPDLRRGTVTSDYGRAIDEQVAYLRAGIDGVFTDNPDIGVVARSEVAGR